MSGSENIGTSRVSLHVPARLGFGCSSLMGRLDQSQSLRLLGAALDAGITHFDTARLYGYGEAEGVLGGFIAGRRDRLTVTTKLGILPPRRSHVLHMLKPLARRLSALHPRARQALRQRAEGMTQAGVFDVASLQRSLETSLRELRTDYVDVLLLHECRGPELERSDLLEFLERCRLRGLARAYGIGTDVETTRLAAGGPLADVLQFPASIFDDNVARVGIPETALMILHSVLGARFGDLRADLACDSAMAAAWSDALGIDARDAEALGRLCIAAALRANPRGVVLFSSTDPRRIAHNARLLEEAPPPWRIEALNRLAYTWTNAAKEESALAS